MNLSGSHNYRISTRKSKIRYLIFPDIKKMATIDLNNISAGGYVSVNTTQNTFFNTTASGPDGNKYSLVVGNAANGTGSGNAFVTSNMVLGYSASPGTLTVHNGTNSALLNGTSLTLGGTTVNSTSITTGPINGTSITGTGPMTANDGITVAGDSTLTLNNLSLGTANPTTNDLNFYLSPNWRFQIPHGSNNNTLSVQYNNNPSGGGTWIQADGFSA